MQLPLLKEMSNVCSANIGRFREGRRDSDFRGTKGGESPWIVSIRVGVPPDFLLDLFPKIFVFVHLYIQAVFEFVQF
jgi:hypothetical protein